MKKGARAYRCAPALQSVLRVPCGTARPNLPVAFRTSRRSARRVRFGIFLPLVCLLVAMTATASEPFGFEEYFVVPLRVHLLEAHDQPALCTTLAESDVARIIGKVNRVWAQAG